jgi:hypothetical protein
MANGKWQNHLSRSHKKFAQAAQTLMDSGTDKHRWGLPKTAVSHGGNPLTE